MPPDVRSPEGGLTLSGTGLNGLVLGDTVGRTPGAYGFFVGCNIEGFVGKSETILKAQLVLQRGWSNGINPLSNNWSSNAGQGPAQMIVDLVRAG